MKRPARKAAPAASLSSGKLAKARPHEAKQLTARDLLKLATRVSPSTPVYLYTSKGGVRLLADVPGTAISQTEDGAIVITLSATSGGS